MASAVLEKTLLNTEATLEKRREALGENEQGKNMGVLARGVHRRESPFECPLLSCHRREKRPVFFGDKLIKL